MCSFGSAGLAFSGKPYLVGEHWRFWQRAGYCGTTGTYTNLCEFPADWNKVDTSVSTAQILDTLDRLMEWMKIRSILFVGNRTRFAKVDWRRERITLRYQLAGWCDIYERAREM